MTDYNLSRREAFTVLGVTSAFVALPGCARTLVSRGSPATEAEASALLDSIAENLLQLSPESATSLGVDTGARAPLRSRLADRSQAGQDKLEATLRADLARAEAIDVSAVSFPTRTSVEVVRSGYRTALEGFAQPYGDVAVGSWRNTPYVVIQNVGAYLDVPRFLDSDHPVREPADADAYIARLNSYPAQLDGELGRIRDARARGLVPPAFLIDKAIKQLEVSLKGAREGGGLVESIERRTRDFAGGWAGQAWKTQCISPDRQFAASHSALWGRRWSKRFSAGSAY